MKNQNKLLEKIILSNAVVFCMINLLEAVTVLLDEVIIARGIGPDAMAAVGLSSPMFAIMSLFASVLAVGAQSMCSVSMGMGDTRKNQQIFSSVLTAAVVIVGIITVAGYLFIDPLCALFGAKKSDPEVYIMLRDYLVGLLLAIPGYIGYLILSPFVMLDGSKQRLTVAAAAQCVINFIGDCFSVFVFDWGIKGVGLFTGISWVVALLILASNFWRSTVFRFGLRHIRLELLWEVVGIGSPRFATYISKILSRIFINRIILLFGGSFAMSIFSVNHSLIGFFYLLGCGLSDSIVLCTQLIYVEKEKNELYRMSRVALKMLCIATLPLMVVVILLSRQIAAVFVVDNARVLQYTSYSIIFLAISIPLNALNNVIVGYMQGARNIRMANRMSIVHRFVSNLAASCVLGWLFGVMGLFAAIPVGELLTFLVYLGFALSNRKQSSVQEKLLFLPVDFAEDLQSSAAFSVCNLEDVVQVSEQVSQFLEREGCQDRKKIYWVSLCVEELAGNTVKHGFVKLKGKLCNVRIMLYRDGTITLRIRDDCPKFDLKEKYTLMSQSDSVSNIGIKLVFGIAKEVKYNNLLGYNNTIIQL